MPGLKRTADGPVSLYVHRSNSQTSISCHIHANNLPIWNRRNPEIQKEKKARTSSAYRGPRFITNRCLSTICSVKFRAGSGLYQMTAAAIVHLRHRELDDFDWTNDRQGSFDSELDRDGIEYDESSMVTFGTFITISISHYLS